VDTTQATNAEPYELIPHEAIREYLAEADEYGSYPTREDFLAFSEVAAGLDSEGPFKYASAWAEGSSDEAFAATVVEISRALASITASWSEFEDEDDAIGGPLDGDGVWDEPDLDDDAYVTYY
jgi:hypothetical protein